MDFETPGGLTRNGDDDRRVEVTDFVGEIGPNTFFGVGEDFAGVVVFGGGVLTAEGISAGAFVARGLSSDRGATGLLGLGVDFGVVRTGIFFGIKDCGGDNAVSGLEDDLSGGAVRVSVSFVLVDGCLVSSVLLEPLTLMSGEVLALSSAIGLLTAGIAFNGSSFF